MNKDVILTPEQEAMAKELKADYWVMIDGKLKFFKQLEPPQVKLTPEQELMAKELKADRWIIIDGKVIFFKKPERKNIQQAEVMSVALDEHGVQQVDPYKKAEYLLAHLYLGGELTVQQIGDDVELFMPIANYLNYHLIRQKKMNWGSC